MKAERCFGGYVAEFGGPKVRCELQRRHKGNCGPKPAAQYQETSRLARESILPISGTIAAKVLAVIDAAPSTTDEVEVALGMKHQTVSAAISALWHKNHAIRPSGKRRLTSSGRFADVMERVR